MKLESGLRKVASALYSHLNTPRSLSCYMLLKYGEFGQLADMAVSPTHYLEGSIGAERYRRDAQASDFLRKSPLLPLKGSKRAAAIKSFYECEEQCLMTNEFLDLLAYPSLTESRAETRLREILMRAKALATRILGPLPDDLNGRFGPGTSFEMKGERFSTVADKLWIKPHVTSGCAELFEHGYWSTHWGKTRLALGLPLPGITRGNRFTTVPKDAKKDRGICIEPLGNLWCQLAVGGKMKRLLGRVGLHVGVTKLPLCPLQRLKRSPPLDGQTHHRRMARDGSEYGTWATIDLSNASDTVSFELVRWVLPEDWFELLCALRSPYTLIEGKYHRLSKFSSMGNGFTFELETLVFAVILAATCGLKVGEDLFVYGDDILLPERHYPDAMAVLRMCGFTPNMRKSFGDGPFKESCGGDFFSGWNVRSVFADGSFESPLEWISLHNMLVRHWGNTLASKRCVEQVPSSLRVFGPKQLGDVVFHSDVFRSWTKDGIRWVATVCAQPLLYPLSRWGDEFVITLALLGVSSRGISPRGEPISYCITKASIS